MITRVYPHDHTFDARLYLVEDLTAPGFPEVFRGTRFDCETYAEEHAPGQWGHGIGAHRTECSITQWDDGRFSVGHQPISVDRARLRVIIFHDVDGYRFADSGACIPSRHGSRYASIYGDCLPRYQGRHAFELSVAWKHALSWGEYVQTRLVPHKPEAVLAL